MKRLILVLLLGAVLTTSVHADIVVKRDGGMYSIHIINKIAENDYDVLVRKLRGIIENYPCSPLWSVGLVEKTRANIRKCEDVSFVTIFYELNSIGGDVETALMIGRLLRAGNELALVSDDSICYSACVLILAGATSRYTGGKIGIHRPYEPYDTTTSVAGQKAKYTKMGRSIKTYLSEMNVKPQLYDDMLYISPENMRILSKREILNYGLVGKDPFQEEADAANTAKQYGISRQEYGKRKIRIDKECNSGSIDFFLDCPIEILEGRR